MRCLAGAACMLVAAGASLRAQSARPQFDVPVGPGDTVQVDAPPGIPTLTRARIVELRPATIVFRIDGAEGDPVVPIAKVNWLAVRRGSRGHPFAGALIGVVVGSVVVGAAHKGKTVGSTISQAALVGGGSGAVVGGFTGEFIRSDNWIPVIDKS